MFRVSSWREAGLVAAVALCQLFARGPAVAQDLNADQLKAAAKEAAAKLEAKVDAGPLVLREDFFKDKFNETHTIQAPAGAAKLTLRDTQRLVLAVNEVAKAMLKVAEPDRTSPVQYQSAWLEEEKALMQRMAAVDGPVVLTPNMAKVWEEFLQTWQAEVVRLAPDRFREALRQAAYSLLRLGLDIEEDWIKTVREAGNAAYTGTQTAGSAGGWSPADRYPWMYHHHYRVMNRIERHSYRYSR